MTTSANASESIPLRWIAAATAVVICVVAAAAVAYLLLDIVLLLFLGIVVAAALRPWHVVLCRWGVPKGLAVLLIYLFLFFALVLVALVVGPVLIEQIGTFAADLPRNYASARSYLEASGSLPVQFLGQRLPPFERLAPLLTDLAPQLYLGTLGVTASIMKVPACFVTVLTLAFYCTMELPRFERLVLSMIAVEHRPRALNAWREIESRLGGFVRGQGTAMLFLGAASALGYSLIGLPNVLALGVVAALLEAVPWIGPLLAACPAILVAVPLGLDTVLMVTGMAALLQVFESNVLIPRIMRRTVGVNPLVNLLAILAFGALYGIPGVLVAVPMAAVIQVLLDTMLVNVEPVAEPEGFATSPWDQLRARVVALRQQARVRLRARTTRMGIDPAAMDHVVDSVDQQIEVAAARVEKLISAAEVATEPLAMGAQDAIVEKLQGAMGEMEQAVPGVEAVPLSAAESVTDNLDQATRRFNLDILEAETLVVAARDARSELPTS